MFRVRLFIVILCVFIIEKLLVRSMLNGSCLEAKGFKIFKTNSPLKKRNLLGLLFWQFTYNFESSFGILILMSEVKNFWWTQSVLC